MKHIKNRNQFLKEGLNDTQDKTLVKYIDVCKETLDGIAADNDDYESFFKELSQKMDPKNKLFSNRSSILCPKWCFEPNTLDDLKRMGYLIEDNDLWTITQKGYNFACSASFHFQDGNYIIKIYDKSVVDEFFQDLKKLKP